MTESICLNELNTCSPEKFVQVVGGVFEHSPWVAQQVLNQRPFATIEHLYLAMVDQVKHAGKPAWLALVRAHPELAGKAAIRGELTHESLKEQSGAGLDQCSPQEFHELTRLNQRYKEKFGFPFILAVRGYDRNGIIEQFRQRVQHDLDDELAESLRQIYRIARFRLGDLVQE